MAEFISEILEIAQLDNERIARFSIPVRIASSPGQLWFGFAPELDEILATPLYLSKAASDEVMLSGEVPAEWSPGIKVHLRGPLGKGFQLPANARRVAVISLPGQLSRLLPVIHLAIQQSAAVTLFSERVPAALPAEVEVLPIEAVKEAWIWADFLALEALPGQIDGLRRKIGLKDGNIPACPAQILILAAYACAGFAECGLCAVRARGGYRLACKDGPVFDLHSLAL